MSCDHSSAVLYQQVVSEANSNCAFFVFSASFPTKIPMQVLVVRVLRVQ